MPREYGPTNAAPWASAPTVGPTGDTYYNSTSKQLNLSDGTVWNAVKTPILPAAVTSGTTIQTYTDPLGDVWVAKNGVNGGNWFRARDVLHSRWYRNAAFNLSTIAVMPLDTAVTDPYTLYNTTNSGWVAPIAGVYQAGLSIAAQPASGTYCSALLNLLSPSTLLSACNQYASAAAQTQTPLTVLALKLNAGDTLQTYQRASSGTPGIVTGIANTYGFFDYLGTG